MLAQKCERFAFLGCIGIAIVDRRHPAHLPGLMIEHRLDNMRRDTCRAMPDAGAAQIVQASRRGKPGRRIELFLGAREAFHAAKHKRARFLPLTLRHKGASHAHPE